MTRLENAIETISEECAEIIFATSKLLRFGADKDSVYTPDATNADELIKEYTQLKGLVEALQERGVLPTLTPEQEKAIKEEKLAKMAKFQEVSKEKGCISD